jgi:hypothetical protein
MTCKATGKNMKHSALGLFVFFLTGFGTQAAIAQAANTLTVGVACNA